MSYKYIFERLWNDYSLQNPSAEKIFNLFTNAGEVVQNDHIAFRTYNDSRMDINVIAAIFLESGYIKKGEYFFSEKHLYAQHFEHLTDESAPRVFISQLLLENFSSYLQDIIKDEINKIKTGVLNSHDLIFHGQLFPNPSYDIYQKLLAESEYAAWFYVFGFRANHFTISINSLKNFNSIEKVNDFIKSNGFLLNNSGGEIKGTIDDMLRQSSTLADHVNIDFKEGNFKIPACYYEFAQRYADKTGKLYSGFVAKSADKIFESTNFYKK